MAGNRQVYYGSMRCYSYPAMSLLRRAAKETVRDLGFNFPTAVAAILGIGFKFLISSDLSAPVTDTITGFFVWLVEPIAWLLGLIVAFVPLFLFNAFKVLRRNQLARASLEFAAESVALEDDQIKSFFRNTLKDPCYGVGKCYVFGSVVRRDPTRDVDVLIQFDTSEQRQVRVYCERMRSIERLFQEHYDSKLHLQRFLSTENESLNSFLIKAGAHERII